LPTHLVKLWANDPQHQEIRTVLFKEIDTGKATEVC